MAQCLIAAGARVVISGRQEDVLQQRCERLGTQAAYGVHDVTDASQADRLMAEAAEKNGGPATTLINNAGVHSKKPVLDTSPDEYRNLWDVHVVGAMVLTRAVAAGMLEQGHGSIVFITSMAALLGLVRSLAVEWSGRGVRVNAIAPGWIDTAMSRKALESDPQRRERVLTRTPMGTLGKPEDIGWAAVYLCSPQARFVTGQQLVVDGGASIGF